MRQHSIISLSEAVYADGRLVLDFVSQSVTLDGSIAVFRKDSPSYSGATYQTALARGRRDGCSRRAAPKSIRTIPASSHEPSREWRRRTDGAPSSSPSASRHVTCIRE